MEEPLYGFDTEFHREKSYFAHLALLQISWPGGLAVVDPLATDIAPFKRVLEGPGTAICHAAEQDLQVLDHSCGSIPARLFDTQIGAAFCGLGLASLAKLVGAVVGAQLPKGDRLTDWTRRPLDAGQIAYAASDVLHLLVIREELVERGKRGGTLEWIEEECERVRTRPVGPPVPGGGLVAYQEQPKLSRLGPGEWRRKSQRGASGWPPSGICRRASSSRTWPCPRLRSVRRPRPKT